MKTKFLTIFILTLISISATAQQPMKKYTSEWKKIDSLIRKQGQTKSALTAINSIYIAAIKEKNDPQIIKALIYQTDLEENITENNLAGTIQKIEKETLNEPARSVLNSVIAEKYWRYFQQNRWKFYNRTATPSYQKDDPETWAAEDFHSTISKYYLASLKNERQLQSTNLSAYDAILVKGNTRELRPTLFDLLTHRALNYFKNDERSVTQPAYSFTLNNDSAFASADIFIKAKFDSKDTISLYYQAILLYQKLLNFHLNDSNKDALIDADIDRLEFVNAHAVMPGKQNKYEEALKRITDKYNNLPAASQAWYLQAALHAEKARTFQPLINEANRYEWIKAKEICDKIVTQKDSSEGKANAVNLLFEINSQEISLEIEKVNLPGQPFRALAGFRNFTKGYFRIVNIDKKTKDAITQKDQDDYWKSLLSLPVLKKFEQQFPNTKDYQAHTAEIKIDALPVGQYALIASTSPDFTLNKNPLAVHYLYVSNIAWIRKSNDYFVLHRESGQPFNRASVQLWYTGYDYNTRKNQERKGENLMTDQNGHFRVATSPRNTERTYRLEIATADDRLFMDDIMYNNYQPVNTLNETEKKTSFLFSDRSIYRPGQTVFFKGIMVTRDPLTKASAIAPGIKTTVILFDANQQKIDSVTVTTNEYGSYSGKMILPSSVLNGRFRLADKVTNGSISLSVEEYKRPKFEVSLSAPKGTYKVNDSITVGGLATAYTGNSLNDAIVKYRVVRRTFYPMWQYGGVRKMIWPPFPQEEVEITNGQTTTDAGGNFNIVFKAVPDLSQDKKNQPVFSYSVFADITDITGETRSASSIVSVGYHSLKLQLDIPEKLHADSLDQIRITSKNLNDVYQKTNVIINITKLRVPDRVFRQRFWQQPDQHVMDEKTYASLFPHDVYQNEDEPANWKKTDKILTANDTTSLTGLIQLPASKVDAGWYMIEAIAIDKSGDSVKDVKYVQLYNETSINPNAFAEIKLDKNKVEKGDKLKYTISSNLNNLFIIHDKEVLNKPVERNYLSLNKSSDIFEIPVSEKETGGLGIGIAFVKYNRIFTETENVEVPYTDKELNISYETFRDKTLPGAEEKWKVRISGAKGDKVASEVLMGMYDASLDQFAPHSFRIPGLWQRYSPTANWEGPSFQAISGQIKPVEMDWKSFVKNYDRLIHSESLYEELVGSPIGIRGASGGDIRVRGVAAGVRVSNMENAKADLNESVVVGYGTQKRSAVPGAVDMNKDAAPPSLPQADSTGQSQNPALRKNFNETAFFLPDLKTDSDGNVEFSFTMPEALTRWKWMTFAHTKDLAFGQSEKTIVTQKDLMVQPNTTRFVRQGDRIDFSGKIVNLTDKEMTGQVELQLIDPTTGQSIDGWFKNVFPNQFFTAAANQSVPVTFSIEIPFQYDKALSYRMIARSENKSDGEEGLLPVLSNRILVTEALQLPVRGSVTKKFSFDKLLKSGESETLNSHSLTVEYTSNPAWYAIQSLPYLADYPRESADQTFNRYYANVLAATIANASPRIREVFEKWKNTDTAALLSTLEKNPELKSVLLAETPWVLQAKSEAQQRQQIAMLFDLVRVQTEQRNALGKLRELQSSNGGFMWFPGGPDDRYMTQYILTGLGHLIKLNPEAGKDKALQTVIIKSLAYVDEALRTGYETLIQNAKKAVTPDGGLGNLEIQYLYLRSFFRNYPIPGSSLKAFSYYREQSQKTWLKKSRYMQAMIALALQRTDDIKTATSIVTSLKQNAIVNEELGMYWKDVRTGYYWHEAPVETQAVLIEAFAEITKDQKAVTDMKTWLLKQKQTVSWLTTRATADACYALFLSVDANGSHGITDLLDKNPKITIKLGSTEISSASEKSESGTGYFKRTFSDEQVKSSMGNIEVAVSPVSGKDQSLPTWGAVYWQYFENMDQITSAAGSMQIKKQLFSEKNSDRGPVLTPVADFSPLKIGDKVKVRIEIRTDRDMEYVHMKDMRAAGMEPVNVISGYKWQDGLGYYESTGDAATNFYFSRLPKGTYVFEYPVFITHSGKFNNGIATIQSLYAPEFSSHSEGVNITVE